jgi:O-antigen ligase
VIPIVIVLMGTLIIPDLAIESEDPDSGMRVFRLGGYLFHPTVLGVLAGVGFFYCIFFLKGKRRLLASAFFFAVLLLTYSRGALLGAIAAGTLCLLVDRRTRARTVVGIIVVIFLLSVLVTQLSEEFISILSRGQDIENLASLSGRVAVWSAGRQMFLERPLLGYGFIAGPKEFLNDYTTVAYWAPPHAHNEFLQSALSGGIFAAILTSFIYLRALYRSLRLANGSNTNTFIMTVIVQLFIYAWAAPLLSYQVTVLSAVMMLVLLYIEIVGQPRNVTVRSRTNSKSAAS